MVYGIFLSGDLGSYWDFPSVVITLGGTLASTLTCFPLDDFANTLRVVKNDFIYNDSDEILKLLISITKTLKDNK